MQEGILVLVLYFNIKFMLYTLWCWLGFYWLNPVRKSMGMALGFGLLRLVAGFILGLGLVGLLTQVASARNRLGINLNSYWVSLILLRWLEWSGISYLIQLPIKSLSILGRGNKDKLWRVGGMVISFVSDLFVIGGTISIFGIPC